jgi:ribosomal protein S18 acetylase RimI-like enzyme
MTLNISSVSPERRPIALRLLFARFPIEEQQTRVSEALLNAERGYLNLDGLLMAEENNQPVGAALTFHQADGVSLLWPPVITCQTTDGSAVEQRLMERACADVELAGSSLSQALLDPEDVTEVSLLKQFGFEHSTDMFFLARQLSADDIAGKPTDSELDHDLFNEMNADRFASVIERTYEQSLDCQFLDGYRSGKKALVSHRLSGRFDPAGWRIYRADSQDAGVLLMNEHPDQDAIELVYLGVTPEFRGRGIGRRMLEECIQAAAIAGRSLIFLSVDCGNIYANALYDEMGFVELARRRVMVRRSR